ncbi:MAG TPA: alpha/beta family hydrolase [Candidatus Saccharimonadales bacterium]|nr:alpha/beta family hydrolase [Candidatus Saccharimonadales bacterium]
MQDLSYKYYHKRGAKTVYLVLHGGGPEGVESSFISNIIHSLTSTGNSVLGFNFPYCERGEENSSGPGLTEEVTTLNTAVEFLKSEGYERIVIVAKSLGNIITSFWLAQHPDSAVEVTVLGYVIGSVKTEALKGKVRVIIQGENDRFGNAQAVKDELATHSVEAKVVEMPQADHSYRNEQKEPAYQDQAIELLIQNLSEL